MAFFIVWVRSSDISWNYPLIPFFSNMEACIALITSSVRAVMPLLRSPDRKRGPAHAPPPHAAIQAPGRSDSENAGSGTAWNSQEETAVQTSPDSSPRHSRSWSLLNKLRPVTANKNPGKRGFLQANAPLSTYISQTGVSGPRTELKDLDEGEENGIPGLKMEKKLTMK